MVNEALRNELLRRKRQHGTEVVRRLRKRGATSGGKEIVKAVRRERKWAERRSSFPTSPVILKKRLESGFAITRWERNRVPEIIPPPFRSDLWTSAVRSHLGYECFVCGPLRGCHHPPLGESRESKSAFVTTPCPVRWATTPMTVS